MTGRPSRSLAALALLVAATAAFPQDRVDPAPGAVATAADRPIREIRVRLACDEEFRERRDWKADAEARLSAASLVFERKFAIRWKAVAVVEWQSDDSAATQADVLRGLERSVKRADADVVVGLSGQLGKKGSAANYDSYGLGPHFGGTVLSCAVNAAGESGWDTRSLAHELGHLMGASHVNAPDSVMSPGGGASPWDFDPVSAEVIELARDFDFAKGMRSLGPEAERRLCTLFVRSRASTYDGFPPANGWLAYARACGGNGKRGEVAAALERAAVLYATTEGTRTTRANSCRISAAWWREKQGDVDGAIVQLEAAVEAASRSSTAETVVGEAMESLAGLVERTGDAARARSLRERVLELRRKALGAGAEETRRIAGKLGWQTSWAPTRTVIDDGPGRVVTSVRWKEDGSDYDVTDVAWRVIDPHVGPASHDEEFARPARDSLHLRAVPASELSRPWQLGDGYRGEVFEFAVSEPGALIVELTDELRSAAAGGSATQSLSVACDTALLHGGTKRIGVFLRRRPGAGARTDDGWQCVLLAGSAEPLAPPARLYTQLDGPSDGAVVCWCPELTSWRFARVDETTVRLRMWRWYPALPGPLVQFPSKPASAPLLIGDATADPDDSTRAPGWRLSVRFVPTRPR